MLFSGMVFFGSATPVSKLVVEYFPVFIAGALRVLLAFLVILPFLNLNSIKNYKNKDRLILWGIGLIGVLGFTAFLLFGMRQVSGVTGSIIMSGTPAVTAVMSIVIFKDSVTWRKVVSLILAVFGVVILYLGGGTESQGNSTIVGIVLVTAAVFCEAGYTLMGKALTGNYPPVEIAGFSAFIGFIGFLSVSFFSKGWSTEFSQIPLNGWLALIWYGVGTMGIGSVLWYKGVKQVEGSIAAAFMGVMPVSALILSYVLLDEPFRWIHLIGFSVTFTGVYLIIQTHQKMHQEDNES